MIEMNVSPFFIKIMIKQMKMIIFLNNYNFQT